MINLDKNDVVWDINGRFYWGKGSGKQITENLIKLKSGDTVTIISPYISTIYLNDKLKDKWGFYNENDVLSHFI